MSESEVGAVFTAVVRAQWGIDDLIASQPYSDGLRVVADESLPPNRSIMVLELASGGGTVTATPTQASTLGLAPGSVVRRGEVHSSIARAGIAMNDPDALFYLPAAEQALLARQPDTPTTRQLTTADADAFARLSSQAPEDDLDEAFVELDHWLVYGSFVDGQLACVASTCPWAGTRLADLGVITLPRYRSQGLAALTVRAMSAAAVRRGYEPQYRCQLDNHPSLALAAAAAFSRFATWHVIEDTD